MIFATNAATLHFLEPIFVTVLELHVTTANCLKLAQVSEL